MKDKKDEVTVLNTDIEQPQKEEDKQNSNKQEKKPLRNKIIGAIIIILFLVIILILILLGLNKCAPTDNTNSSTSTEQNIDIEKFNKTNNVFKEVVNKKLQFDLVEDSVTNIVTVTYEDNYPTSFDLNITAVSASKIYYYTIDDSGYLGNKEDYSNIVEYLLIDSTDKLLLDGDVTITPLTIENTVKENNKYYVAGKSSTDKKYAFGFYKTDNNEFNVYQNKEVVDESNPLSGDSDIVIKQDNLLYDYYRGLLG